jgi:hypothetical protein
MMCIVATIASTEIMKLEENLNPGVNLRKPKRSLLTLDS